MYFSLFDQTDKKKTILHKLDANAKHRYKTYLEYFGWLVG